jgi:Protein of unknown function (DUF1524)
MSRPLLAAAAVLLALSACSTSESAAHDPGPHERTPQSSTTDLPSGERMARATARLAALRTVPRSSPSATRYVRDAFGESWLDTDRDGCNQRDDVLLRDAVPGSTRLGQQGACDHDVLAGTWHDPYTGKILQLDDLKDLSQAEAVQIDHIVPLAEAWVSGASAWSRARREAFANYLPELLAVDGPTNASKGDGDPAAWRPRKGYQCQYAVAWIAIKRHWDLGVDTSERNALGQMLSYCG